MRTFKVIATACMLEVLMLLLPIAIEFVMVWFVINEFLKRAAATAATEHNLTVVSPGSEKIILVAIGTHLVHQKVYCPAKRFINNKIVKR
jgi:hypothetical protein